MARSPPSRPTGRARKAAGVLRSPYHFFDATVDGVVQAEYFLAAIDAQGGFEAGDLPPMLDLECPTSADESTTESGCEYSGDSGWVDHATLVQRTFDWLTTVEAATGKKPLIYSYSSWFESLGFTDARLADYPLFYIASYATCATVPAPWTSAVFWQYGDDGSVAGIHGGVDVDRFFGTAAELAAFAAADNAADAGVVAGADAASGDHDARADDARGGEDARDGDARAAGGLTASGGCQIGGERGGTSGAMWILAAGLAWIASRRMRKSTAARRGVRG